MSLNIEEIRRQQQQEQENRETQETTPTPTELTVQDVRDMVASLQPEEEPQPRRVNPLVPGTDYSVTTQVTTNGMTDSDGQAHMVNLESMTITNVETGEPVCVELGSDWTDAGGWSTDAGNTVEAPKAEEPKKIAEKKPEAKLEELVEELSEEQKKKVEIQRKKYAGRHLYYERQDKKHHHLQVRRRILDSNTAFIGFGRNDRVYVLHHEYPIDNLSMDKISSAVLRDKWDETSCGICSGSLYDKNMNPLSLDISVFKGQKETKAMFPLLEPTNSYRQVFRNDLQNMEQEKGIFVNKKALFESKGRDFRIKERVGITLQQALLAKKRIIAKFDEQEELVTKMKNIIGGVYDQDNFEIIYLQPFGQRNNHKFWIFVHFPDLIIKNSIEDEHKIHSLVTRITGSHLLDRKPGDDAMMLSRHMDGTRYVYDPKDMNYEYKHSHLPRSDPGMFEGFCMGSSHFMSRLGDGVTTDLELEAAMIAMYDHVAWESLEGGPYYRMEDIGNRNRESVVNPNTSQTHFRNYCHDSTRELLDHLDEKGLDTLKEAFSLVPDRDGNVRYQADVQKFISLFVELYDDDFMTQWGNKWDYTQYIYNPEAKTFRMTNGGANSITDWKTFVRKAEKSIKKVYPLYMNNKYIQPEIVETEEPEDLNLKKEYSSVHPNHIMVMMRFIQGQLIKQLKNVNI